MSLPSQLLTALNFFEKVGGVPVASQLGSAPIVTGTVAAITAQLQPPPRKAPPFFISVIIALEHFVVSGAPVFHRAIAWIRLIKVWSLMRTDDVTGIDINTLVLDSEGFSATLSRTKVSGPGRAVRWLPIFVSLNAFLADADWLKTGFLLCTSPAFGFVRDYFVPGPSANFQSVVKRMANASEMAAYGYSVLACLRCSPDVHGCDAPLLDHGAHAFWTGYSERAWLPSAAAYMGYARADIDLLGRWLHQVHEAGHQRHPDGERGEGQNHPERVELPRHCGGIHREAADHRCASGIHAKIWYEADTDNRTNVDSLCGLCFK